MHFYQHNIKTFNSATRHLTRVERSVYRDLIELYYDSEQPLTSDEKRLQRLVIANTDEEKEALIFVLNEYFELKNDAYHHEYCDKEIEKYKKQLEAKSAAGKASAAKRKQSANKKTTKNNSRSTGVKQPLNDCSTNQEPRTNNQEPIDKGKTRKARFSPPDPDQVKNYFREKGVLEAEAIRFHSYYTSNGWMVGKNKMKDWQAAARGWIERSKSQEYPAQKSVTPSSGLTPTTFEEMMRAGT